MLSLLMEKNNEVRFSNWNADKLPDPQLNYAMLGVDGSLRLFEELNKKLDLTLRLEKKDVVPCKQVDLVP